jgi:hypothetical protein
MCLTIHHGVIVDREAGMDSNVDVVGGGSVGRPVHVRSMRITTTLVALFLVWRLSGFRGWPPYDSLLLPGATLPAIALRTAGGEKPANRSVRGCNDGRDGADFAEL